MALYIFLLQYNANILDLFDISLYYIVMENNTLQDEQIIRTNLGEQVTQKIKSYIIENSLGSGDRLPTEKEFATLFGVSRLSAREAIKRLGFLGIIDSSPKRGQTVGQLKMDRVTEYLGFHFAISKYPTDRLLKTRIIIEMGALPEVMNQMKEDPKVYDELAAICDRLLEVTTVDDFIRCDLAFHKALVNACGIEPLVAFNDLLQIFFQRFRDHIEACQGNKVPIHAIHRKIIDSLHDGYLEIARDTLRVHLDLV
jgi:GntR family transcriptional regulator, transcriptional repressor for pyruvate dehydrogenase complex